MDNNALKRIFETDEVDIETFADVVGLNNRNDGYLGIIPTSSFSSEKQKFIEIVRGYHEQDYVWHIKTSHKDISWAASYQRVAYAIAVILNDLLPRDLQLETHLPSNSWEIEEFTIKALMVTEHWSVSQEDLDKVTGQMFEVLNTLVDAKRFRPPT
jgi:hypothetical protein